MQPNSITSVRRLARVAALGALVLAARSASAGPIDFDTYWQFSFDVPGGAVKGCFPDDLSGLSCVASGGTPTVFLDAPPWTFVAPAGGATLTVIDAFLSGDRFDVFDNGAPIGSTSEPSDNVDCGDDPVACLTTTGMSTGVFALGFGLHSLTMTVSQTPNGAGSGYLQVTAVNAVPEPATLALLLGGLAAACGVNRRRSGAFEARPA